MKPASVSVGITFFVTLSTKDLPEADWSCSSRQPTRRVHPVDPRASSRGSRSDRCSMYECSNHHPIRRRRPRDQVRRAPGTKVSFSWMPLKVAVRMPSACTSARPPLPEHGRACDPQTTCRTNGFHPVAGESACKPVFEYSSVRLVHVRGQHDDLAHWRVGDWRRPEWCHRGLRLASTEGARPGGYEQDRDGRRGGERLSSSGKTPCEATCSSTREVSGWQRPRGWCAACSC